LGIQRRMGNQHSAPDKDKDRDKEREKDKEKERERDREPVRPSRGHERALTSAITPSPVPPAETKVNAEHIPNANYAAGRANAEPHQEAVIENKIPPPSTDTSPVKAPEPIAQVEADIDLRQAVQELSLSELSPSTGDPVAEDPNEGEAAFEALRPPSETSLIDEGELRDADRSGMPHERERLMAGVPHIPLIIDWSEGGDKVSVAGSFTGWRKRVNLRKTWQSNLISN
jgi:Glycogen recognition site of AMP-activated protein kinase